MEEVIKVGSGTIVKRAKKNGFSYQARVRKNGVNVSKTCATLTDAKNFITEADAKALKGEVVSSPKIGKTLLAEIFQDYLNEHPSLPLLKAQRIAKLKLELSSVQLAKFKTAGFQKYINTKLTQEIPDQPNKKKDTPLFNGNRVLDKDGNKVKKVYKPSTVRKYYYDIKMCLEWHAKEHDYPFNSKPFDEVPPPEAWKEPRTRRLEEGELEKLLAACSRLRKNREETKQLLHFLTWSAFRSGETFLIKWKDVKLIEEKPQESYIYIPKENQKTGQKKAVEDRYASIRPELYYMLLEMRKVKLNDTDFVFKFWKTNKAFYTSFKRLCKNGGLINLRPHDLRHEGVAWFFENTTLSDIEISKITGHVELETLKRYANLRPHKVGAKLWQSLQ